MRCCRSFCKKCGERHHEPETGRNITSTENIESIYKSDETATIETPPLKKRRLSMREIVQDEIRDNYEKVSDIKNYFNSKPERLPVPTDSSSDIYMQAVLTWWKTNEYNYPLMSNIAKDHLAIPAASVQVERIFSGCRDLYGIRRNSLHANTVKMLMQYKSLNIAFPK